MFVSNLCTPAMLYFVISVFYIIIGMFKNFNIISSIIRILLILAWSWILNFLCESGYTFISWILVLLPFIFM